METREFTQLWIQMWSSSAFVEHTAAVATGEEIRNFVGLVLKWENPPFPLQLHLRPSVLTYQVARTGLTP